MTRKFLSLMAALILLLSASIAFADAEKYCFEEAFNEFDFEMEIPEGAKFKQNPKDGWLCFEIWFDDEAMPMFDMDVSFSEETDGQNLGDMSDEEKIHLMVMSGLDFSDPAQSFFVTEAGNMFLFTREIDPEAGDFATMMTVYKGFFFSLSCHHSDFGPLSDDDLGLMHQIIEGAWIIDAQA